MLMGLNAKNPGARPELRPSLIAIKLITIQEKNMRKNNKKKNELIIHKYRQVQENNSNEMLL